MALVNNAAPEVTLTANDAALVAQVQADIAARAATVALPATGVDPTAVQIAAPAVAAPVVQAPIAADPTGATPVGNVEAGSAASSAVVGEATATTSEDAVAVELTPSQKIAAKITTKKGQIEKLLAEVEKLEAQFRSADKLDKVATGSVIVARVGRAETAREVQASVVGVQTLESGDRRLKIFFGEGFDAETVVIQDSQIVDIVQV